MRRTAIAAVALAVVALGAAGCSSSPEQVTASMTSPPRPELRSELAPDDPALPADPDDPSGSFGELPEGFEDRMTTVDYGAGLRVSFASRLDQIHLKLYAFADRREARDESDLQRLAPTADELTAAARWAMTHNAPGPFDDEPADALRAFGVSDVGRDV